MYLIKNKLFKNLSLLSGINFTIQILSLFSSIRLAKLLEPIGYGIFNLVFLQASIFSIISCYGLRNVIIRHIGRNKEDVKKIFIISNQIRIFTSIISIFFCLLYNILTYNSSFSVLFILAVFLSIFFQTFWDTLESISFGYEKITISGLINLIFTILWILEIYLIPLNSFNVTSIIFIYISNQIFKTIIYYFWVNNNILNFSKFSSQKLYFISDHKIILKQANFFFIISIFTAFQNQIPILFLQLNSTIDQIGYFNLGNRILSPLQMMLNTLLTAIFPMLSRLAIQDKKKFVFRIKSLLNITIMLGIWASFSFTLFSHDVVAFLYGHVYKTTSEIIVIQCWFTLLFAIFCIIGTVLSALNKHQLLSFLSMIYTIIAFPFFYLGSKDGAIGLSIAFVISAFINMSYHWIIFRKVLENGITIIYSISLFIIIGMLTYLSYNFDFNISITIKFIIEIFITLFFIIIFYKIEYKKLSIILKNQ